MKISKLSRRSIRGQHGHIFILTLIMIAFVSLALGPLLNYIANGRIAGNVFEAKTEELYDGDAGIEYAYWLIRNQDSEYVSNELVTFVNTSNGPKIVYGLPPWMVDHDDNTETDAIFYDGDPGEGSVPIVEPYNIPGLNVNSIEISIQWLASTSAYDDVFRVTSTAYEEGGRNTQVEAFIQLAGGSNLDIFDGAIVSTGGIDLKKECSVIGDIIYGDTFDYEDDLYLDGEAIYNPDLQIPTSEDNEEFLEPYLNEALSGGTIDGDVNLSGIIEYGPKYINGNLSVGKDSIITLQGNIYVTGSIDCDKESEFQGEGSIIAEGDIYLAKVADYGDNTDSIIMSLFGDITFKKEADVHALIYAPNGNITFDMGATVVGSIVCAGEVSQIESDKGLTVVYDSVYNNFFELPGFYLLPPDFKSWIVR